MTYSQQFEKRRAAANGMRPGKGVLLICGTGFEWHLSNLEDFIDFYRRGVHREDDSFAKMEAHDLAERSIGAGSAISASSRYIKRPMDHVTPEVMVSSCSRGWRGGHRARPADVQRVRSRSVQPAGVEDERP